MTELSLNAQVEKLCVVTTQLTSVVVGQKDKLEDMADIAETKAAESKVSADLSSSHRVGATNAELKAHEHANRSEASANRAQLISGIENVEQAVTAALDESFQYAMTKAEWDALAAIRQSNGKCSGWLHMGKHFISGDSYKAINEGLGSDLQTPNILRWGRRDGGTGESKYGLPVAIVKGAQVYIEGVGNADPILNRILFPPASDGCTTWDNLTGMIVEHDTAADAFDYQISNHDFRNESADWYLTPSWSIVNNQAVFTHDGANASMYNTAIKDVKVGDTYELSIRVDSLAAGAQIGLYAVGSDIASAQYTTKTGVFSLLVTVTNAQTFNPHLRGGTGDVVVDYFSVRRTSESVIIDRKDYCYLEVFHEVIGTAAGEKDIVLPLGNVHFIPTTYKGISLKRLDTLGVEQGYSAFGEWDKSTIGRGVCWSTLPLSTKRKFLAHHKNNIYYDEVIQRLVQVRYRVCTVKGFRNSWHLVSGRKFGKVAGSSAAIACYQSSAGSYCGFLRPQGKSMVSANFTRESVDGFFVGDTTDKLYQPFANEIDAGIFAATGHNSAWGTNYQDAYEGKLFALPICLVQRLNKGCHDKESNPNGTRYLKATNADGGVKWFDAGYVPTVVECFTPRSHADNKRGSYTHSGKLSDGISGRQDQHKYYDALHVGLVQDLRFDYNNVEVEVLKEKSIRNAVGSYMRGKGRVPFFKPFKSSDAEGSPNASIYSSEFGSNDIVVGSAILIERSDGTFDYTDARVIDRPHSSQVLLDKTITRSGNRYWLSMYMDDTEFDSLPYVVITGTGERVAATFPNGCMGEWIDSVPDGTSKLFGLPRKAKNTTTILTVQTSNDGATWVDASVGGFSAIKNGRTATVPVNEVGLYFFESMSGFTVKGSNDVLVGVANSVEYFSAPEPWVGNRLQHSLTGEIGKSYKSGYFGCKSLNDKLMSQHGKFYTSYDYHPAHNPIKSDKPDNDSKMCKVMHSVVNRDGLLHLQFQGSSLVHDFKGISQNIEVNDVDVNVNEFDIVKFANGFNNNSFNGKIIQRIGGGLANASFPHTLWDTSFIDNNGQIRSAVTGNISTAWRLFGGDGWGDDGKIPILAGEGLKKDLNGNIVKTFCHISTFPIGVA